MNQDDAQQNSDTKGTHCGDGETAGILARDDGTSIAYDALSRKGGALSRKGGAGQAKAGTGWGGVVFLHGLHSDRNGTKALATEAWCRAHGLPFVRFDMFGHGGSSGAFEEGTISRWTEDTLAVLDSLTQGPQILVGSSMGGWVMLRAALRRRDRVAALVGLAAAPDFTRDLMWRELSEDQRNLIKSQGYIDLPSCYGPEPYRISRKLIEDGEDNLLLDGPIALTCPVRLIHGQHDQDVPWRTALRLAERLESDDVEVTVIKRGEHRLSEPSDLALLTRILDGLLEDHQAATN